MKQLLQATMKSHGALRLVIVMVVDSSKPGGFFPELRQESVAEARKGLRPFY